MHISALTVIIHILDVAHFKEFFILWASIFMHVSYRVSSERISKFIVKIY